MALAERENVSFVGRRIELDGILGCILDNTTDRPSMVAITGPAGIGWKWGGSWTGGKDYQHFSSNGQ